MFIEQYAKYKKNYEKGILTEKEYFRFLLVCRKEVQNEIKEIANKSS